MKLKESIVRKRSAKAVEMLGKDNEPLRDELEEQMGLTSEVKEKMREVLRQPASNQDKMMSVALAADAFLTLFPNESGVVADLDLQRLKKMAAGEVSVVEAYEEDEEDPDEALRIQIDALYVLTQIRPDEPLPVEPTEEMRSFLTYNSKDECDEAEEISYEVKLRQLFPAERRKPIPSQIVDTVTDLDFSELRASEVLKIGYWATKLDPRLRQPFHELVIQHPDVYKQKCKAVSQDSFRKPEELAEVYAELKIILTEEVRLLPDGRLIIPSPTPMKQTDLPARSMI